MKKIFYLYIIASCFLTSCKKELTTDEPTANFAITNARSTEDGAFVFKVGDTCRFGITGYADNITFWNGLPGNSYSNKTRPATLGKIVLSFTSQAQYGSEANTVKVFAFTNVASLDSAALIPGLNAGTLGTDITSRTALSITGNTAVPTGDVDLTDLVKSPDDALYIAFRYKSTLTTGNRRTWTITNYNVRNIGADFNSVVGNLLDDVVLWTRYGNVWLPANKRWTATTSNLTIVGGTNADPDNESWIISKPMYVGRLSPDTPTGTVKNLTGAAATGYEHTYNTVGTYKATFVYFNNTTGSTKSGTKEFTIKVIP